MTKTKSKLLFLSLTGFAVISVVIAAGILIYQNSLKAQAKKVVDESVLYLGVPYKNDNQTRRPHRDREKPIGNRDEDLRIRRATEL
jgi:hypothetical protein